MCKLGSRLCSTLTVILQGDSTMEQWSLVLLLLRGERLVALLLWQVVLTTLAAATVWHAIHHPGLTVQHVNPPDPCPGQQTPSTSIVTVHAVSMLPCCQCCGSHINSCDSSLPAAGIRAKGLSATLAAAEEGVACCFWPVSTDQCSKAGACANTQRWAITEAATPAHRARSRMLAGLHCWPNQRPLQLAAAP